jgi:hypothetical protein
MANSHCGCLGEEAICEIANFDLVSLLELNFQSEISFDSNKLNHRYAAQTTSISQTVTRAEPLGKISPALLGIISPVR